MANLYVKSAVDIAKREINDIFEGEEIRNVGLEEIVHDSDANQWRITIGFSRPWETDGPSGKSLFGSRQPRSYKMVRIDDNTREVVAITDRALPDLLD